MLKNLGARQTPLALLRSEFIDLMQLLHQSLLVGGSQPSEAGVTAENALLVLHGQIVMLVQPGAQMTGGRIGRRHTSRNRRTGIA